MKRVAVVFVTLLVILMFIGGFYLYYVPRNQEIQKDHGFTMLQEMETVIQNKVDADMDVLEDHIQDFYNRSDDSAEIRKMLKSQLGVDSIKRIKISIEPKADTTKRPKAGIPRNPKPPVEPPKIASPEFSGKFHSIEGGRVHYWFFWGRSDSCFDVSMSVNKLFSDLEDGFSTEMFWGIILFKVDSNKIAVTYKSDDVYIGPAVITDSVFKHNLNGFYPGIADARLGQHESKIFYIPISIGDRSFLLCGLADVDDYNDAIHEVPPDLIYLVVIIVVFLLAMLPAIKLWSVGTSEAIRLSDVAGYFFSLLCGSMLLALAVIHLTLLWDANHRQQQDLESLTKQISAGFSSELRQAYAQLRAIDSARNADSPRLWLAPGHDTATVTDRVIAFLRPATNSLLLKSIYPIAEVSPDTVGDTTKHWFRFDQVVWLDSLGKRIVAASLDTNLRPMFNSDDQRPYYANFTNNRTFRLPGGANDAVTLQPAISWENGKFRFMLARRSLCKGSFLVALAADLKSVTQTIMPDNYWFCIVDIDGKVQAHSDPSKNLLDNIILETPEKATLQGAMNGSRAITLERLTLYGKSIYGFRLLPLGGPFYFVGVFHDRRDEMPIHMRILGFALFGCLCVLLCSILAFLLCWTLRGIPLARRWKKQQLLAPAADYLRWILPTPCNARLYYIGTISLLGYIASMIVLVLSGVLPMSTRFILFLLTFSPCLICGIVAGIAKIWAEPGTYRVRYLRHYTWFLLSLTLAVGALPAALFSCYAHDQEILQSVKRSQLSTALSIEDRMRVYDSVWLMPKELSPYWIFQDWRYHRGIYSTLSERRNVEPIVNEPVTSTGFNAQYFDIAAGLGGDYFEPKRLPVLEDVAANNTWRWSRSSSDSLDLRYDYDPDVIRPDTSGGIKYSGEVTKDWLTIRSKIPDRYPFFCNVLRDLLLASLVGALLYTLFWLIRRLSMDVFLTSIIEDEMAGLDAASPPTPVLPKLEEYFRTAGTPEANQEERLPEMRVDLLIDPCREEGQILKAVLKHKEYLDYLKTKCEPEELRLLYHFAQNGFMNHKSKLTIRELLADGILLVREDRLKWFSPVFRAYILLHVREEMLVRSTAVQSSWQTFRLPFLILLLAVAAFLFFTREAAWQRITALIAAFSTALGLMQGIVTGKVDTTGKSEPTGTAEATGKKE